MSGGVAVLTDYDRGFAAGLRGDPGPAFARPDTPWSLRLFNRGWEAGIAQRVQNAVANIGAPSIAPEVW